MLHKRPGWEFRRILKAQGPVKVIKPGQLVKFFDKDNIIVSNKKSKKMKIITILFLSYIIKYTEEIKL